MADRPHDPTEEQWQRIERAIASEESPVGIDAKRTHIMILQALERIEARLEALERQVASDGR